MTIVQRAPFRATAIGAAVLYIALHGTPSEGHQANAQCASTEDAALVEARAALERDPASLPTRLQLADTYIEKGCFDDAAHVLEQGEALHPRNRELQSRLRTTRSMLSEQQYFEGLDRAEQAAKLSRLLLRCNKIGDIDACEEAIVLKPDDMDLLSAKGDALMRANRPVEALLAYRRVAATSPTNAVVAEKIAAAQAQRQALLAICHRQSAEEALRACESAFMRGADDEFAIHKRKAILLQSANRPSQALDSYIAANLLQKDDKSVALSIVALSESTARKDAMTLAARGSALLTLGRAMDALSPLRQALALAPGLADLQPMLAKAERLASVEKQRQLTLAQSMTTATEQAAAKGEITAKTRRYSNSAPPTRSN